jgi:hypothetical protein
MSKIKFTSEELTELTEASRQGAAAIAKAWDVLGAIGDRLGLDWEPINTSVADVFDVLASALNGPESASAISAVDVEESFNERQNWSEVA